MLSGIHGHQDIERARSKRDRLFLPTLAPAEQTVTPVEAEVIKAKSRPVRDGIHAPQRPGSFALR